MLPGIVVGVCKAEPAARWILIGGRTLFADVKRTLETSGYRNRISMLAVVRHDQISELLRNGHFFLN
jgi:hypothetical protein